MTLAPYRNGKPGSYPDQAIYAEYACDRLGLDFRDIDGGGQLFVVSAAGRELAFGGGRCSYYPQNNATAASLAADKAFANALMERAGVRTLGGRPFFLHDRHRAHRAAGHERDDAVAYFGDLGGTAFVKPLHGSRGDFAQPIADRAALQTYLDEVARYYDSVLLQPIVQGDEYRVFLLDDEVLYAAKKQPPALRGDGVSTLRQLLAQHDRALHQDGLSAAIPDGVALDRVLPRGESAQIAGRRNRSAGGVMALAMPPNQQQVFAIARQAVQAFGLRIGAVDLFTQIEGDPDSVRIIEVNANPAIGFLEQTQRGDLILAIWRHTFAAMGLLDV